ncbi:unnamed protein product [Urochloa humidicola]
MQKPTTGTIALNPFEDLRRSLLGDRADAAGRRLRRPRVPAPRAAQITHASRRAPRASARRPGCPRPAPAAEPLAAPSRLCSSCFPQGERPAHPLPSGLRHRRW